MNRLALLLLVALAVALAGCSGFVSPAAETPTPEPPSQQPTDADAPTPRQTDTGTPDGATTPDEFALTVSVDGDGPFHLTVHVVDPENTGLRVFYVDDSSREFPDARTPAELPPDALDDARGVEPLTASQTVSFERRNGTGGVTFLHPGGTSAVLYSLSDADGTLLSARLVECEAGTLTDLTLTVADERAVATGHQCLT